MSKLARLVAERVMELTIVHPEDLGGYYDNYDGERELVHVTAYNPDKDITDAWEVVRRMRDRPGDNRQVTISVYELGYETVSHVTVSGPAGKLHEFGEHIDNNENPCVAICIAALRALGVSETEIQEATA